MQFSSLQKPPSSEMKWRLQKAILTDLFESTPKVNFMHTLKFGWLIPIFVWAFWIPPKRRLKPFRQAIQKIRKNYISFIMCWQKFIWKRIVFNKSMKIMNQQQNMPHLIQKKHLHLVNWLKYQK